MIIAMNALFSTVGTFFRNRPAYDWLFFGLAIVLYVGLSIIDLTKGSIWFDEAFSAYLVQFSFADIARYTGTDVHPPFYYWLLKIWTDLFGTTEAAFRSMSILFGAVAALFGYLWTRKAFGRRAAFFALGILIMSPLFIRYSQEARMYTLAAAIIMAATYVMTLARETNKRWLWIMYGILVSMGMWTHYFTALAWIAHLVWHFVDVRRAGKKGKALWRAFFAKDWLWAYGVAIALYLPWLPAMAYQLLAIQTQGFWIGPVGLNTVGNYFGTLVYFLKGEQIIGWFAAILILLGILFFVFIRTTYRKLATPTKTMFWLLFCLSAVPPILLFVASLPPLTPSFVERYLLPAAIASALLAGVVFSVSLRGQAFWRQLLVMSVVAFVLLIGMVNMYDLNNYNKSSGVDIQTRELVQTAIVKSEPGVPIIASSPWTFYEAIFYETPEHQIYFIDETTEYIYGSLDMLKENDMHKIKDLDAFTEQNSTFWFVGYADGELEPPRDDWKAIDSFFLISDIDGKTVYKATKYQVN